MQNDDAALEVSFCPSFSPYFSDRQAVAARVINEALIDSLQPHSEFDQDRFSFADRRFENRDCADDEFEFDVFCNDSFSDSEIGCVFPIFNCDVEAASVTSLAKLFVDEKRDSSSEEEEEVAERFKARTHCVWRQKKASPDVSPRRCKKSNSTGSTSPRRWKLSDLLLRRSNSGGKDSFVFLTPPSTNIESKSVIGKAKQGKRSASGEYDKNKTSSVVRAHELFYGKSRAAKEEEDRRRKSYLPYRNGIFGFGLFGMSFTTAFRPL